MSQSEEAVSFRQKLEELAAECRSEQERVQNQLSEMEMLLRQTNSEIDKLSQRAASVSGRRREMEVNLEDYSRVDIKNVYSSALETEMRKLTMDNQRERLVSKLQELKGYHQRLDKILRVIEQAPGEMGDTLVASSEQPEKLSSPATRDLDREEAIKLIKIQEDETLRVSRRIQDELVQPIANVLLKAEICERLLSVDTVKARGELVELRNLVGGSLQDLRDFVQEVRPLALEDLGLEPSLRRFVENYARRHDLQIELSLATAGLHLPSLVEVVVFRLIQECLSLGRQSRATEVQVRGRLIDEQELLLEASYQGSGGALADAWLTGATEPTEMVSLRHRVEGLGGTVQVERNPDETNHLEIRFPVWLD